MRVQVDIALRRRTGQVPFATAPHQSPQYRYNVAWTFDPGETQFDMLSQLVRMDSMPVWRLLGPRE